MEVEEHRNSNSLIKYVSCEECGNERTPLEVDYEATYRKFYDISKDIDNAKDIIKSEFVSTEELSEYKELIFSYHAEKDTVQTINELFGGIFVGILTDRIAFKILPFDKLSSILLCVIILWGIISFYYKKCKGSNINIERLLYFLEHYEIEENTESLAQDVDSPNSDSSRND